MAYWNRVFRRAVREAAKEAKLDTLANAMIALCVPILISLIIWVALGYALPNGTLWARVLATATPFLILSIAMVVRFFAIPAQMAREDEATINSFTAALDSRERKKVIKDIIGSYMQAGNRLLSLGTRDDLSRMEPAEKWVTITQDFINAAFGSSEATLFLSDVGYTFYSSDGKVGNWIKGRLRRLEELLKRVDILDIEQDFDPTAWL
jgi:hypothetical protein